jgi:DNA-binding NtrC family response regulator
MAQAHRVLVADDDPGVRFFLCELLRKEGLQCDAVKDGREALRRLREGSSYSLLILDERMPGLTGLQVLEQVRALGLQSPVIMITAYGSRELALRAVRQGAYDFFTKPLELEEIRVVVRRALERYRLEAELRGLRQRLEGTQHGIVARSPAMRQVLELLQKVAPTDMNVLITGESGTGKELVARALHALSGRAQGPFVSVNCAAIPEGLLESELFGAERGAYTGAYRSRAGKLQRASGGTVLLDEVAELSPALQAKLLRVLEEKAVEPLGGTRAVKVDFRVVAATNQPLKRLAEQGGFRQDLYWRLAGFELHIPPLRERPQDIPALIEHFLRKHAPPLGLPGPPRLEPQALKALEAYPWPGNVRELENFLQRALLVEEAQVLRLSTVQALLPQERPKDGGSLREAREMKERQKVVQALTESRWHRGRAAQLLGISRKTLFLKMKKYGLL